LSLFGFTFLDLGTDITISSITNGFFGIFPSFASVVVGDLVITREKTTINTQNVVFVSYF